MFNIINHQGNANLNHNEASLQTRQNAEIKKYITTTNAGEDKIRETGSLTHGWWECKMILPLWKTIRQFL